MTTKKNVRFKKNGWTAERVRFGDLKDGNTVFYRNNPFEDSHVYPLYPNRFPLDPEEFVWVLHESWLIDHLGYNPSIKISDVGNGADAQKAGSVRA